MTSENFEPPPEYFQAETAKLLAEAKLIEAQALREAAEERSRLERHEIAIQADLVRLEDLKANNVVNSLRAVKAERDALYEKASNFEHSVYRFASSVNASSVYTALDTLTDWHRTRPGEPFEIIFNSPGGSVIDGMELFDYIRFLSRSGHRITIGSRGYAASMAGILLQAGDHRWIGAESYLMIHEISAGTGGKIGEMEDAVRFYKKICERVTDIFVNRSNGKLSRAEFVKGWKAHDWWLSSNEALKLGLVDEIR